jgi:glycine cleavage system H protein
MSEDFMGVTYDKFLFTVKHDYLYHPEESWAKEDGDLITVGVTDFFQKTAGDVAFIELPEIGTEVARGSEAGVIETIKITVSPISPVSGLIKEVNTGLRDNPQWVNNDPYGEGWLFKVVPSNWEAEKKDLMDADTYFPRMEGKIREEMAKT